MTCGRSPTDAFNGLRLHPGDKRLGRRTYGSGPVATPFDPLLATLRFDPSDNDGQIVISRPQPPSESVDAILVKAPCLRPCAIILQLSYGVAQSLVCSPQSRQRSCRIHLSLHVTLSRRIRTPCHSTISFPLGNSQISGYTSTPAKHQDTSRLTDSGASAVPANLSPDAPSPLDGYGLRAETGPDVVPGVASMFRPPSNSKLKAAKRPHMQSPPRSWPSGLQHDRGQSRKPQHWTLIRAVTKRRQAALDLSHHLCTSIVTALFLRCTHCTEGPPGADKEVSVWIAC